MKLSIAQDDGNQVCVAISGQVTQREVSPIEEPLALLLGPTAYSRLVRLDLSNASFMDSSGVGWLLTCQKRMRQAGGKLTLFSPHPIVANVLKVLKLERVFDIEQAAAARGPAGGGS
ncbi:MAG TPA: STAS domain-containing protein [Pirellulaceae bacterium]|nr:STAS domain-containing protein [Pirellulaceae bacterium]